MYFRFARESSLRARCGFTLVELLLVIVIIGVVVSLVVLLLNPGELMKRSRDKSRISDFEELQTAINVVLHESVVEGSVLCNGASPPCSGRSDYEGRVLTGSGWVKVDFTQQTTINFATLPVDPINNVIHHYVYYSNGLDYEINGSLESEQLKVKMTKDGGDNVDQYEFGTKLNLIP